LDGDDVLKRPYVIEPAVMPVHQVMTNPMPRKGPLFVPLPPFEKANPKASLN
jgi:hypothetical protein